MLIHSGETPIHENGLGFVNDIFGDNEIDNEHFIQIDLGDYIRLKRLNCFDPKIKIGSIQIDNNGEQFKIYGSNKLGYIGILLKTYTNTLDNSDLNASKEITIPSYNTTDMSSTGDLYLYGPIPFRYISVTAGAGSVMLNSLTLYFCEF